MIANPRNRARRFADWWRGIFFMLSSVSLIILMAMFILVWQPMWSKGFNDFHKISAAISELDETTKPAANIVPLMLDEMAKMNNLLAHIEASMRTMNKMESNLVGIGRSMQTLEAMDANFNTMNDTMDEMNWLLYNQLGRMSREVNQMNGRISPLTMMTFNW